MAIENIEKEASAILGMMAGSTHPRSGRMVLAEKEMLRLLNFVRLAAHQIGKAVALEVEMDIVARERDSYRASFNNERIRADKWEHVQDLNVKIKQAMHERFRRAERERDELKALAEEQSQLAGRNAARVQQAEAEIARLDAAAGEVVHLYREHNPCNGMKTDWIEIDSEQLASLKESTDPETAEFRALQEVAPPADAGEPVYQLWSPGIDAWVECNKQRYDEWAHMPAQRRTLYTAAPPAVLPPEQGEPS